jgi:hypothetical protein
MSPEIPQGHDRPQINIENIKGKLQDLFDTNYENFKNNPDINKSWLIVVRFSDSAKEPIVSYYDRDEQITFPYGNLSDFFEASFREDIDESLPPIFFSQSKYVEDEGGMPEVLRTMVGKKVWEETKARKLIIESGKYVSVSRVRYYPLFERSAGSPLIEFWPAERTDMQRVSKPGYEKSSTTIINPPKPTLKKIA